MSDLELMTDLLPATPQFKTGVGGGSSLVSPETEEFESLEKSFREELQQKLHERKISEAERKNSDLSTGRRLSELSSKTRKGIEIILSTHFDIQLNLQNIFTFNILVRRILSPSSWWRRGSSGASPGRTSTYTP